MLGRRVTIAARSGAMPHQTVVGLNQPGLRARPLLRTVLGEVLRRTRLAQGRTLADVARAARVSVPYLSELERGCKEGSSEVLAAICDALLIDLSELLAEAGRELVARRAPAVRPRAGRGPRGVVASARFGRCPAPAGRMVVSR
jgi:hypothetical protein